MSEDLLKKDNSIKLVPNDGFFITTSIVSNKKDKIVYAEISESVKEDSLYLSCEYSIFTKDLTTDKITKIYSHLSEVYNPLVYFPIAWSKNDKKIILEWGNPIRVGSGGVPYYETFTIDPMGGEISVLATEHSLFIDDYNKVVYVGESENSPSTCSPDENNRGVIILKEIESGQQKILAEEENSYYVLKNIDEDFNLTYTIKKVINVDRCSEFDELTPEKSLTLKIK
ncbi:MAG: hypothetical protein U9Q16_00825 [Patescibacteria group bacterium]|nr:hypothetical protein [Patescibacteria group bacterium]